MGRHPPARNKFQETITKHIIVCPKGEPLAYLVSWLLIIIAKQSMDLTSEGYWRKLINQGLIKFFLLKVLYKDKESYGYRIVKRIEELSDGTCRPTESTIYPALEQLKTEGYAMTREMSAGSRTRIVYVLTDKGRSAYRAAAKSYGEVIPLLREAILL
ncbi:MAG TPA: PadR family transcriptional regulator [bacterium]|nr:PadR family transcriptional regulator [bacterium]